MREHIKCGRVTYELQDGDTVMDNGHFNQFISRLACPKVSKKEFKRFLEMTKVSRDDDHQYRQGVTLWRFTDKLKQEKK